MEIRFLTGKDEHRLAKQIIRRLPSGVLIGEPGRLENEQGQFIGWGIAHPALTETDQIRLQYVMDTMAANDQAFTNPDLDDEAKVTVGVVRATLNRIDAVPAVDALLKAAERRRRDTP